MIRISAIGREMLQRALEERRRQPSRIQLRNAWQRYGRNKSTNKWTAYPEAFNELTKRLGD
jgi:hypothetical protein